MKQKLLSAMLTLYISASLALCIACTGLTSVSGSTNDSLVRTGRRTYAITSEKHREAAFVKTTSTSSVITVPATVKLNGTSYKVTGISARAFKGNTDLKKITIGKNVASIGKGAFNGCLGLKTINIESKKLAVVNDYAFKGIQATARIKVPGAKLSAYRKLLAGKGQDKRTLVIDSIKKVAIDAGHQQRGNSATEPIGPGSSVRKAKVSAGASGISTRTPEYKLNLSVAKKLDRELKSRGYETVMIRSTNNVDISNMERALAASRSGADIFIRIHADGSSSSSVKGASVLCPSASNPFIGHLSEMSRHLSACVIKNYCKETGIQNRGLAWRDDLTGTNWSSIPVTLIELGFLSNPSEDELMQQPDVQDKMADGIADGIDEYFWK